MPVKAVRPKPAIVRTTGTKQAAPVAIVTGASSGIGKVIARELARLEFHVVMVCRDAARAKTALADVRRDSRNRSPETVLCDLSSQTAVRKLAKTLNARFPEIAVLVNNAGAINPRYVQTEDGIETTFAVNHLAPFLLTNLLLPNLKRAKAARVITLASEAQRLGRIHWDNVSLTGRYSAWSAYTQSKLANIMFTAELARRLAGTSVIANCLHPGAVSTGFAGDMGGPLGWVFRHLHRLLRTPEEGADTAIWLAAAPEAGTFTGKFLANRKPRRPRRIARNPAALERFWKLSAELTNTRP
jgi:NAD(P)-dependent dehydrogenase (short-subunit alcohol dehydrogenase family)